MYKLGKKQKALHKEMREIGVKNKKRIINDILSFIKHQQEKPRLRRPIAVIGISGGVDSALTAALAVKALGKENIFAVKLPYLGLTSRESFVYADSLVNSLALPKENVFEIPINEPVDDTLKLLEAAGIKLDDVRIGNVMARQRMNILYAIAGAKNGMVLDTCNKTEILLGYFTRYGDGASDYNPIGGLYKTWVLGLAEYLGVPKEIVQRIPTAELAEGQTDENDLGISYEAADLLLWLLCDKKVSVEDLARNYCYPREIVRMTVKRVETNRFKSELPPVCKIEL